MLVYVSLAVASLFVAALIWRYDLYEKEPIYMVIFSASCGFVAMWLLGYIETKSLQILDASGNSNLLVAVVASTHEEFAKLAIVGAILIFMPKHFNDPLDGLIYGSIVGLGMAVEESIFYIQLCAPEGSLFPPNELVRLFGHPMMGGISGFALGMIPIRNRNWPWVLAACITASVTIHFLWDCLALRAMTRGRVEQWESTCAIGLMFVGLVTYGRLIGVGAGWSKSKFSPAHAKSLWGWPFRR